MKLSKIQWLALIVLFFFYFRDNSLIGPTPFVADLRAEELESKAMAGMLAMHTVGGPSGSPESFITQSDSQDDSEVVTPKAEPTGPFRGRLPRVILLTDTVRCAPCKVADSEIVQILKNENYKSAGWTVGPEDSHPLQVLDLAKEPGEFWKYANLVVENSEKYSPSTPTFVRVNKNGDIEKIVIGNISMKAFLELQGAK